MFTPILRKGMASTCRIQQQTLFHTSCIQSSGFFARPSNAPSSTNSTHVPQIKTTRPIAQPHTPSHIPSQQAPNFATTWSENQASRLEAMKGPRFEQIEINFQPQPQAAIEMIAREPIRMSSQRIVSCDGGGGPLGHPKVFINLDKPGPKACPYCGIRFQYESSSHH